jgi:hypothetical protein
MKTEKRLIWLDDLMKFPIRIDHYDRENGNEHFVLGIESVLEYAENLPTVDAVEVVRCKDCRHYIQPWQDSEERRCSVFNGSYDRPFPTEPDDFCSYGERRTDDKV